MLVFIKVVMPLTFACSPGFLHRSNAVKNDFVHSLKRKIASNLVAQKVTPPSFAKPVVSPQVVAMDSREPATPLKTRRSISKARSKFSISETILPFLTRSRSTRSLSATHTVSRAQDGALGPSSSSSFGKDEDASLEYASDDAEDKPLVSTGCARKSARSVGFTSRMPKKTNMSDGRGKRPMRSALSV